MAVDIANHVPAVGLEPAGRIVAEPRVHFPVDRNAVVVVYADQLAQAQHARQRTGLVRYAFHQAAVAQQNPGPVVDDFMLRAVEFGCQQPFGKRHSHRVGQTLTQWPRRGLDADLDVEFRVAGRVRAKLPEGLELVDVQGVAGQVRGAVQEHGTVPVGQYQPVAVHPVRLPRRHLQVVRVQQLRNVRHAHGHAGMAGVGALHGVHGQCAQGVCALPARAGCHWPRHLMEQPWLEFWLRGPCPVLAIWTMASNSSRGASGGPARDVLESSRPRYCSSRSAL